MNKIIRDDVIERFGGKYKHTIHNRLPRHCSEHLKKTNRALYDEALQTVDVYSNMFDPKHMAINNQIFNSSVNQERFEEGYNRVRELFEKFPSLKPPSMDGSIKTKFSDIRTFNYDPDEICDEESQIEDIYVIINRPGGQVLGDSMEKFETISVPGLFKIINIRKHELSAMATGDASITTMQKLYLYLNMMNKYIDFIVLVYLDGSREIFSSSSGSEFYVSGNVDLPQHFPADNNSEYEYELDMEVPDEEEKNAFSMGSWALTGSPYMIIKLLEWLYKNHYNLGYHGYRRPHRLRERLKELFEHDFKY